MLRHSLASEVYAAVGDGEGFSPPKVFRLSPSSSFGIFGIESSHAVWANCVAEFRLGVGRDIAFQRLPRLVLIPNLLTGRADGQQTAQ